MLATLESFYQIQPPPKPNNQQKALTLLSELLQQQSLCVEQRRLGEETLPNLPKTVVSDVTVEFYVTPKKRAAKTLLRYALLKDFERGRLVRWWDWIDTIRLSQLQVHHCV
jgi:hypothetical protein